jgi:hypothetical protein
MFLETTAKTPLANWVTPKEQYKLHKKEKIAYDAPPYPGIESLGLNGAVIAPPGKTV